MKQKIGKSLFLMFSLILVNSDDVFSQSRQKWIIKKAINTNLELGSPKPAITDFQDEAKFYVGRAVYIQDSLLFFDKQLKNSNSYSDTIFFKGCKTLQKVKDNNLTYRYPGDELACIPANGKEKCFVGESFMNLLESKDTTLMVYDMLSNYPNFYSYKLCIITKNKRVGLLLENSLILLILEKEGRVLDVNGLN